MTSISRFLQRFADTKILVGSTVIFVVFLLFVLPNMTGNLERSPDTSFWYTASDLYDMAESYGAEGRAYYIRTRFTFDVIWPLVYCSFLAATLSRSFPSPGSLMNLLPLGAVLFDFFENIGASVVMVRFPNESWPVANLTPVFTFVKWILIGASFAALCIGSIMAGRRWIRSRWR